MQSIDPRDRSAKLACVLEATQAIKTGAVSSRGHKLDRLTVRSDDSLDSYFFCFNCLTACSLQPGGSLYPIR